MKILTIEKLKLEFFEFYQHSEFTLIFYHDAKDNKIIFKIYKDNIPLENHCKIINKIKKLELDKNKEIKPLIIYEVDKENKENEDNRRILNFEEYFEKIKEECESEENKNDK